MIKKRVFIIWFISFVILFDLAFLGFCIWFGSKYSNYNTEAIIVSLLFFIAFLTSCVFFIKPIFDFTYRKLVPPKGEKKRIEAPIPYVREHITKAQMMKNLIVTNIISGTLSVMLNIISFIIIIT